MTLCGFSAILVVEIPELLKTLKAIGSSRKKTWVSDRRNEINGTRVKPTSEPEAVEWDGIPRSTTWIKRTLDDM